MKGCLLLKMKGFYFYHFLVSLDLGLSLYIIFSISGDTSQLHMQQ